MLVLSQFGVAMGGQKFSMGIDIDALSFSLLQEVMEISKIVTTHEDRL